MSRSEAIAIGFEDDTLGPGLLSPRPRQSDRRAHRLQRRLCAADGNRSPHVRRDCEAE